MSAEWKIGHLMCICVTIGIWSHTTNRKTHEIDMMEKNCVRFIILLVISFYHFHANQNICLMVLPFDWSEDRLWRLLIKNYHPTVNHLWYLSANVCILNDLWLLYLISFFEFRVYSNIGSNYNFDFRLASFGLQNFCILSAINDVSSCLNLVLSLICFSLRYQWANFVGGSTVLHWAASITFFFLSCEESITIWRRRMLWMDSKQVFRCFVGFRRHQLKTSFFRLSISSKAVYTIKSLSRFTAK